MLPGTWPVLSWEWSRGGRLPAASAQWPASPMGVSWDVGHRAVAASVGPGQHASPAKPGHRLLEGEMPMPGDHQLGDPPI